MSPVGPYVVTLELTFKDPLRSTLVCYVEEANDHADAIKQAVNDRYRPEEIRSVTAAPVDRIFDKK
jgi:hypothetical protein